MLARLRQRWAALPVWTRWVLAGYVVGLVEGTGDHIRWMLHGGIHAYAGSYPQVPIQVLFVSLVLLDPLAAVLAAAARRAGVYLTCAIMVLDMIANWAGNWSRIVSAQSGLLVAGLWLITAFGLFVLTTAVPVLRALRADRSPAQGLTLEGQ